MSTNHEFYSTMKEKGDGMKKNKKGFTLVEIIVVLVIIGILIALAVPAVMSYVRKAADTKLISEARSVMVASKEKGIELVKKQQLDLLATDENMKDIMKRSEVEGTLMEIYKNKANNGAGDFIVLIGETYIRYDDQQQKYEILTSYDNLFVKANEIHLALIKGEPLSIIQAFIDQKDKAFINSEGANAGNSLRKALNDAGIASGYDYSFRIYASKSDNNYTITISERKVTLEDIKKGNKVKVIQYDYSGNNGFSGTPRVKTANASVKLGEDSGGTQDDYAALKLDDIKDWEVISQ